MINRYSLALLVAFGLLVTGHFILLGLFIAAPGVWWVGRKTVAEMMIHAPARRVRATEKEQGAILAEGLGGQLASWEDVDGTTLRLCRKGLVVGAVTVKFREENGGGTGLVHFFVESGQDPSPDSCERQGEDFADADTYRWPHRVRRHRHDTSLLLRWGTAEGKTEQRELRFDTGWYRHDWVEGTFAPRSVHEWMRDRSPKDIQAIADAIGSAERAMSETISRRREKRAHAVAQHSPTAAPEAP